jgi:hypothetical protein
MTFRKISLTFLFIILSVACAYAKKQPKYEQAHPLTPEQAALVERAIGREKVLIKNIQQRTPLVETYIQNTKPDIKLYQVPISDEYILSDEVQARLLQKFGCLDCRPEQGSQAGFEDRLQSPRLYRDDVP